MRNRWMKRGAATVGSMLALLGTFAVTVVVRSERTFDAPYPAIQASKDPAVIEKGRYLVYGAAHCVDCHVNSSEQALVRDGAMPPLAGGYEFKIPIGSFFTPNLTPDKETGIGRYTDAQLARVLRHGVMPDGSASLPFMEFQNMSDEDLTAIISFLRSQPAVKREIPENRVTFVGRAVMAFLIKPHGPSAPVLAKSPAVEPTIERGAYLANNVANCAECHTRRNMLDGSYAGERFSGGMKFQVEGTDDVLVSPNLTPSKTGHLRDWDEERFVGRFGAGVGPVGTHMPWRDFQRMSEEDIRAIYRYLRTLPPSDFDPGPIKQKNG